jgi:hypothetical protein
MSDKAKLIYRDYISPDDTLRFLVQTGDGDITMGFDGYPWHTHGDILAALSSGTPEGAMERYIADLIGNGLIIGVARASGRLWDATKIEV